MMKGRIDARFIVSYVLSFVLSLILLCGSVLVAIEISLFNQNSFVGLVGRNYYTAVYDEVTSGMRSYTIPTGIDVSVVEGIVSVDDIMSDLNGCMYSIFEGSDYTPDLTKMDEQLRANVKASFEGLELENQDEIIDAYVEDINNVYINNIKMPVLKYIVKAKTVYDRYLIPALIILLGLVVLIGATLIMMYRRRYKGLRYLAYATGAAAVMSFGLPFYVLIKGIYRNFLLSPEHFYNLRVSYIRNALMTCLSVALFWAVVTVLLALSAGSLRKRTIKKGFS